MNNPELYNQINHQQFRDAEKIIQKFNEILLISKSKAYSLIDVGTGCGKVLSKVIAKQLNVKFERLIGLDICNEMVEFAKQKYENEMIKFPCIDVIGESKSSVDLLGKADIVTCFYCLHWNQDSRNALTNINKLLSPNGWFLCLFLQSEINFNGFLAASKEEKFSNCLSGIEEIFLNAENQKENCNVDLIRNITEDLGLDVKLLELKRHEFDQETRENYKNFFKAINPYMKGMSQQLQDDLMNYLADYREDFSLKINGNISYIMEYEIIFLIAQKT